MPSLALETFQSSCKDVDRLLEIHGDVSGDAPGRKYGVEVLNKASYVLLSAFWEAFCEDVAGEALDRLVDEAPDSTYLPTDLKRLIAQELQDDPHQLATWQLADAGWRDVLVLRLEKLRAERNRSLNTPNAANIDAFLERALGIKQISKSWYWSGMSIVQATRKLDRHLKIRHEIAHRGGLDARSVTKANVNDFYGHVWRLVEKTDAGVNKAIENVLGGAS